MMPRPRLGRWQLAALVSTAAVSTVPARGQPAPAQPSKPVRVLFIGNSYTYVNNLPELVRGLAAGMASPVAVVTEQVTMGGATLRQLWEAGPALSAIRQARWDYVVVQEQSTLGPTLVNGQSAVRDPASLFWPAARLFDGAIREAGAKTVLLETWAPGAKPEIFQAVAHAYFTIGKELGAAVIPAGLAWQRVLGERRDLPLYMEDGSHPAPAGSYLAALATVGTLLGRLPDSPPLTIMGHRTGVDAKPDPSLGTLAKIDSATATLFRRVVIEIGAEIKQAGGYPAIARPPFPGLPPLPPGRPIPPGALLGMWSGTIQLFTVPGGQTITLDLRPDGAGYTGVLAITPDPVIREAKLDVTIAGREVRFSLPSPMDDGLPIQFRGVLATPNRLEGRASIRSDERGWDFSGAWTVTRR